MTAFGSAAETDDVTLVLAVSVADVGCRILITVLVDWWLCLVGSMSTGAPSYHQRYDKTPAQFFLPKAPRISVM